jgi:hypothetical protein
MSHAWSFLNRSTLIQLIKAGECVGLKNALELGQMALRMFTLRSGEYANHTAGAGLSPAGRLSRT